jgi:CheY-like chemotaxis protein
MENISLDTETDSDGHVSAGLAGVLIVDDNRLNGAAIRRAFSELQVATSVFEVRTCGEALDALHGVHSRIDVLPRCVLLLNLDMPHSFEFLEELRRDSDQSVRNSTVFVHSTSNSVSDRNRAYDRNVAGYIHDRPGRKSLLSMARLLREYIRAVELPDQAGPLNRRNLALRHTSASGVEASRYVRPSPIPSHPTRAVSGLKLPQQSGFESWP